VVAESLSDPSLLMPKIPPFRSALVLMCGAANIVARMTLLSEPMLRSSPSRRLARTTDDMPICMSWMRPDLSAGPESRPPTMRTISSFKPLAS